MRLLLGLLATLPFVFSSENSTEADGLEEGEDEERLLIDIFRDYNYLIRPVHNASSPPVVVDFGVAIVLLINVVRSLLLFIRLDDCISTFFLFQDEKNQILQTNVWLTMKWHDFQLKWNPQNYGDIGCLR